MDIDDLCADHRTAFVETHHHIGSRYSRTVRIGAMQGTSIHHTAVAGCKQHRYRVDNSLGDRWKLSATREAPLPMATRNHPQAVLCDAVAPGHRKVKSMRRTRTVRPLQTLAFGAPVGTSILVPTCRWSIVGRLMENSLVKGDKILAMNTFGDLQDFSMPVHPQGRVHQH